MRKKTYIRPVSEVINMEVESLLASSPGGGTTLPVEPDKEIGGDTEVLTNKHSWESAPWDEE